MSDSNQAVLELCAGGGGQSLGLEQAGFELAGAVEIDNDACTTLVRNRPHWTVHETDLREFNASALSGVDVVAAGVPCPPFSMAGRQLGEDDERDLFPAALRVVKRTNPRAVMFENVRGLSMTRFDEYRTKLFASLDALGYVAEGRVLNASGFGVAQLRPRFVIVALRPDDFGRFTWPTEATGTPTVGEALHDLMASRGWKGVEDWREKANQVGPTIVGGSRKHGGPDLGPTRAKQRWQELGVDGKGIANEAPSSDEPLDLVPKLTVRMAARLQGFPDEWLFAGGKTSAYRQVGNAFPPPVAQAVGTAVLESFEAATDASRLLESAVDYAAGG